MVQGKKAEGGFMEWELPIVNSNGVYLSCPVLRFDDTKASLTSHHFVRKMRYLSNILVHDNVDKSCLDKKDTHLNPKGRLTINFLSLVRRL